MSNPSKNLILVLLLSVLTNGCSKKSIPVASVPAENRGQAIVPPIATTFDDIPFVTPSHPEEPAPKNRNVSPAVSEPARTPEPDRTVAATETAGYPATTPRETTFAPAETEHIRLGSYNPFGNGNRLTIDPEAFRKEFRYPYPGKVISPYGYRGRSMHTGVDIKAVPDDTIRCILSGVVRMSKSYSGYGNVVVVRHANGLESVYAHNSRNLVRPNDRVKAGAPLALAGRTGRATTEHVHFELRVKGEHFDPALLLDTERHRLKDRPVYLTYRNGRVQASLSNREEAPNAPISPTGSLYAGERRAGSGNDRTAPASGARASAQTSGKIHVIRKGDTLYAIARKYGTTVADLCRLNRMRETQVLSIGDKLQVR